MSKGYAVDFFLLRLGSFIMKIKTHVKNIPVAPTIANESFGFKPAVNRNRIPIHSTSPPIRPSPAKE